MKSIKFLITVACSSLLGGCLEDNDSTPMTGRYSATVVVENACGITSPHSNAYFIVHNEDFSTKEIIFADQEGVLSFESSNSKETISVVREIIIETNPKLEITTYSDIPPTDLGVITQAASDRINCICSTYDIEVELPIEVELDEFTKFWDVNWQAKNKNNLRQTNTNSAGSAHAMQFQNVEYCVANADEQHLYSATGYVVPRYNGVNNPPKYLGYTITNTPPQSLITSIPTSAAEITFNDYSPNPTDWGNTCTPFVTHFHYSTLINGEWIEANNHTFSGKNEYNSEQVTAFVTTDAQLYRSSLSTPVGIDDLQRKNSTTHIEISNTRFFSDLNRKVNLSINQYTELDFATLFDDATNKYDLSLYGFDKLVVKLSNVHTAFPIWVDATQFEWQIIMPNSGNTIDLSKLELSEQSRYQLDNLSDVYFTLQGIDYNWLNTYEEALVEFPVEKIQANFYSINDLTLSTYVADLNFSGDDVITFKSLWQSGYHQGYGIDCY